MITARVIQQIPMMPTRIIGEFLEMWEADNEMWVALTVSVVDGPAIPAEYLMSTERGDAVAVSLNELVSQCECGSPFRLCHPEA